MSDSAPQWIPPPRSHPRPNRPPPSHDRRPTRAHLKRRGLHLSHFPSPPRVAHKVTRKPLHCLPYPAGRAVFPLTPSTSHTMAIESTNPTQTTVLIPRRDRGFRFFYSAESTTREARKTFFDLQPLDQHTAPSMRINPAFGAVFEDLAQGCREGETITGTARTPESGKDIVMMVSSSGPGVLVVQESQDSGATWQPTAGFHVVAGVVGMLRLKPASAAASARYRVQFTADQAASKVNVTSHLRA